MNDILYYPYINIPRTDWALRTLLYYDTISSIVPREYFDNPQANFDPFMLKLVQAELVIPLDPMRSLKRPSEFSEVFRNHIQKYETSFRKKAQTREDRGVRLNNQKFSSVNLHGEKFDSEILYSLQNLGLAEHQHGNWYTVERSVANLLMKSLAAVLSKDLEMLPTTDQIEISAFMSQKSEIVKKRNTILKELIPFPEQIDFQKLRTFKDKHRDLLNDFKIEIELITLDQNIKQDSERFKEIIRKLNSQKEELSAKMNESQFGNIIFGTVCGLISAGQGFVATGNNLTGLLTGLPGFATAVHSASKIERAENVFDQTGLKYLALMDKKIRKKS
jgi:hypothetical protein